MTYDQKVPHGPSSPGPTTDEAEMTARSHDRINRFGQFFKSGEGTTFQQFVFKGVRLRRAALLAACAQAAIPEELRARIRQCANTTHVYRHSSTDAVRTRTLMCNSRWCPVCSTTSVFRIKRALFDQLHVSAQRLSFLTLTQPQMPGEGLKDTLRRLREAFGRLRRSALWRTHADGGLYVIEVTHSKTYIDAYHVHLHIILEHTFVPLDKLCDAWERASGARGVDIKRVKCQHDVHAYISKYLSKPAARELYDDIPVLAEVIEALRGRPMLMLFGTWRGLALHRAAEQARKVHKDHAGYHDDEWKYLGSLELIIGRAQRNDAVAKQILLDAGFGPFPLDFVQLPFHQTARSPPCRQLTLL